MIGRRFLPAALALILPALASAAAASTFVDREIRFSTDQVRVERTDGHTRLVTPGAMQEDRAGRPDLPWFGEPLDIPDGQKVTAVEVIGVETEPIATGVKIESAARPIAGSLQIERTAPDPVYFASDVPQPAIPVELGTQGWQRGRHEVWLKVAPVRWSPRSGLLERITRVQVRLTLDADTTPDDHVVRQRIVADWEDEPGPTLLHGGVTPTTSFSSRSLRGRAQPFSATQIPSLLGSPVEYVIVTNETMAPQFQRLADWKTQSGHPAVVRTIEWIRQQYPGGADDGEKIRKFLQDAYARWGTKWVLLGGDTDVIPARYGYTTFYGGNYIASDLYYSCLDGNWNADGDSIYGEGYFSATDPGDNCDLMPDVYVGRAATISLLDAQHFVDRVFQYSRTPVGDYETNILMFGEVLFPQDWHLGDYITLDGASLIEEVLPTFTGHPEFHIARLYENYTDTTYTPGALPETRTAVLDSLDRGYGIAVHVGHGYRNTMSVGVGTLDNNDASGLTNGNRLMNLYAIDCTSNAIDFPSIGEAFMSAPNGGAVSNIGSTNFDFPTAGRVYQDEYFNLLVADSVTAIGEAQAMQKLPYVPFSVYDGVNRWTQFTLLLLGDPEMHVWTNTPRTMTVSAPASMSLSDTTLAINVKVGATNLVGARVTAYQAGVDFSTGTTDASGNITLPFRPDSLGTLTLTVTGFNCRPFQTNVTITSTALPLVVDPSLTIDDDNVGGTSGNGDGFADAGETVDLLVPLRNNGGSTAPSVSAALTTTDPDVTISVATVNYGAIPAGSLASPPSGFRISTLYTAGDQREMPFTLRIQDGAGHSRSENFQVTLRAPEPVHASHVILDTGGNNDGVPDPGETIQYTMTLRNAGTGTANGVTVKVRNYDGLATVTDSTASFGDIAPGASVQGDPIVFQPSSTSAQLEVRISDQYGLLSAQMIDIVRPLPPDQLAGSGQSTNIKLQWHRSASTDVMGYNIYRATSVGGPYVKVNSVPTDRTAYYMDSDLTPLTSFYFEVTAVDSSANESVPSTYANASTNPPTHTIFPIPLGGTTPASVAVDHVYPGYPMDIFAGANVLYAWHPDGTSPVDADGQGTTAGDFSTLGSYFAAGPSLADLDGDGSVDIIAPTWTDTSLYVFQKDGSLRAGWPLRIHDPIWSAAAIGDLDNDGSQEIAFGSNGTKFYVMRADGSEWMDGDSNPATKGVFKVLGAQYNYGTPALADINNDGYLDIVYGSFDGNLYVWDRFGNNLPGFPVNLGAPITASVAVGALDGPGDTSKEIVVPTTGNLLYVINNDGSVRAGFPLFMKGDGSSKTPSPALADMNGDGYLDIVQASTNGGLYVIDRTGHAVSPWVNIRYSNLTNGASESSPVVADINGDGLPDVVIGGEDSRLCAFGNNGAMLPGFPIILDGEVRGTPALCDCDGDGKTEIVLAGWDKMLHVWDYDFPFSPGKVPQWPQFHHDARRTGYAASPVFVGVNDSPATPARVEFAIPAPNPATSATRIAYAIPADHAGRALDLAIFDLSGRRVRTLAHGTALAGRQVANWDLRGDDGSPARAGVYFARLKLGAEVQSHKLLVVH